jgi:hypothetical protein
MSELRKPDLVFLLKKKGNEKKTAKVELFDSAQWEKWYGSKKRYRIRANGKWFPKDKVQYFDKWEVRDLIWRSFKF